MPLLSPRDLIRLCYDHNTNLSPGTRRERLRISRQKLHEMEREGTIVIEEDERLGGMRILEPWREESPG